MTGNEPREEAAVKENYAEDFNIRELTHRQHRRIRERRAIRQRPSKKADIPVFFAGKGNNGDNFHWTRILSHHGHYQRRNIRQEPSERLITDLAGRAEAAVGPRRSVYCRRKTISSKFHFLPPRYATVFDFSRHHLSLLRKTSATRRVNFFPARHLECNERGIATCGLIGRTRR